MPDPDQFGPRLRREREKRRVRLEEIAVTTNVGVELWEGLERNDFSRWPTGIFARAFIRDYARIVGLDPDAVVNEFCRHFPLGDRRAARIVRAKAELIGHPLEAAVGADPLPPGGDRRRTPRADPLPSPPPSVYRPRLSGAAIDCGCVIGMSAGATFAGTSFWPSTALTALLYFSAGTILFGVSPGTRLLEILRQKAPALFTNRRAVTT